MSKKEAEKKLAAMQHEPLHRLTEEEQQEAMKLFDIVYNVR